jgi:hypothetical protein
MIYGQTLHLSGLGSDAHDMAFKSFLALYLTDIYPIKESGRRTNQMMESKNRHIPCLLCQTYQPQ